jgi:hypothetical protein
MSTGVVVRYMLRALSSAFAVPSTLSFLLAVLLTAVAVSQHTPNCKPVP